MKKLAKNIFFRMSYLMGIIWLFYRLNRRRQVVINYHHILPEKQIGKGLTYGYSHSVENFIFQLSLIKKKFEITTSIGKKATALITFDDGARNNFTYALPVLNQLKIHAYFFIVHNRIENNSILWIDKWFLWIDNLPNGDHTFFGLPVCINTTSDKLKAHGLLWDFLRKNYKNKKEILAAIDDMINRQDIIQHLKDNPERFHPLVTEQIEHMKSYGHLIGSHGLDHDILSALTSEELTEQCKIIKDSPAYNTRAFSVPFGEKNDFTPENFKILNQYGFRPIFMNQRDGTGSGIGRINLPDSRDKFLVHAYLSGYYYFLKKIGF